jgi:3-methylcrotonyl-CoA carboxylase alpha subunit
MEMISSLLIANRGEIARRIIRTAKRLGIRTIAVYSDADAAMPFVREADEAVHIGPAPARESYLVQSKILEAAKALNAEAIHPGYGFLSENAEFAEAVQAAGIVWVGAPPAAIRAMGQKDAAKQLMLKAGVPVTPGYMGDNQNAAHLHNEANGIGYPVLIKAVAGGGGKGMRRVDESGAFLDALASCQREAQASFGDARVLIEKYITGPRHIEVQVFGDLHGNVVHLFERDCSLQRRHQKVIEEAPAPGMDEATRATLCAVAVKAAQAINYAGAGTIEFIADASEGLRADRIWFMEMNTRLQVEHPATEMITGQDLVEWQLRVASGEKLPKQQGELAINGWAMEARLYAENPATGFLPSIGPLQRLRFPEGIRVDSGVEEGGEVTPFYDPMIAKLITHAPTRKGAAAKLEKACGSLEIWPVKTNAGFLARTASDEDFLSSRIDTGFIERHSERLVAGSEPSAPVLQAAARALLPNDSTDPWAALTGLRIAAAPDTRIAVDIAGFTHVVALEEPAPAFTTANVAGEDVLFTAGEAWSFGLARADHAAGGAAASDGAILSPMPGRIIAVHAAEGDRVAKGQKLLVLEAMKMEQQLLAPFDGVVKTFTATLDAQIAEGVLLALIEKGAE